MILSEWIQALVGGLLIGLAASLLLLCNGRVAGISGIFYRALSPVAGDWGWRLAFIFGLVCGGLVTVFFAPGLVPENQLPTDWTVLVAGLLVGFGTVLGSGCTSGHGVCGIGRGSKRSIAATLVFMAAGILSVLLLRRLGILP